MNESHLNVPWYKALSIFFRNPTPQINELITTKWTPIKTEKLEYLHIDAETLEMKDALFEKRVEFWRSLPLEPKKKGIKDEL